MENLLLTTFQHRLYSIILNEYVIFSLLIRYYI